MKKDKKEEFHLTTCQKTRLILYGNNKRDKILPWIKSRMDKPKSFDNLTLVPLVDTC